MERGKTLNELREQEKWLGQATQSYKKTFNQKIEVKETLEYLLNKIPELEKELQRARERLPKLQEELKMLEATLPSDKKHKEKLTKKVELLKKKLRIEKQLQTIA